MEKRARDGSRRGGARPGAGRKPGQTTARIEFRGYLRGRFTANQRKLYDLAWKLAEEGQPAFLSSLVAHAFGAAPQAIQLSGPGGGPVELDFGALGAAGSVSGAASLSAGVPRGDGS
jgi:hypothetical protein